MVSNSIKNTHGKDARIACGAVILQQMYNLSDRDFIEMVESNPYFQYFLRLKRFQFECPFTQLTLVQFRKRITLEMLNELNESVCQIDDDQSSNDDSNNGSQNLTDSSLVKKETKHKGKLILDATCAPQDIKYPTDWDLLNKAREKTEAIIDHQHNPMIGKEQKVRTYRVKASKKKSRSKIRKVLRFQLECINRNY